MAPCSRGEITVVDVRRKGHASGETSGGCGQTRESARVVFTRTGYILGKCVYVSKGEWKGSGDRENVARKEPRVRARFQQVELYGSRSMHYWYRCQAV